MERDKVADAAAEKTMLAMWNCPISEVVNVVKGTYCYNPKKKDAKAPALPKAESAKEFVTTGKDADLNKAMDGASMAMINTLVEKKKLTRLDAYALASMTMDCRIAPPKAARRRSSARWRRASGSRRSSAGPSPLAGEG